MKKRLIDANDLEERIKSYAGMFTDELGFVVSLEAVLGGIEFSDTVDAVEVVRCKDCEWWMYEYDDVGLCVTDIPDIDGVQRLACDFCSYGMRKGDGNA